MDGNEISLKIEELKNNKELYQIIKSNLENAPNENVDKGKEFIETIKRIGVNKMLTIFTPTFNRAHTLPRLYESLLNQTDYNFEWLIVDDGSSDDTSNLIETFKDEKFPIRYIYQNNGGKHIASNVGLKAAKGDIFVVLDSDDWFYPNAVQVFNEKFKNNEDMKALITLDTYENGDVVGGKIT